MSIWMEMRCDSNTSAHCYSAKNNGPMALAVSFNRGETNKVLIALEKEAKEKGWKRVRSSQGHRWVCPECRK